MIETVIYFYIVVAVIITAALFYEQYHAPITNYMAAVTFGLLWPVMGFVALTFFIDQRVSY